MSFRICHLEQRTLRWKSGEKIEVPNVIRLVIPSRVVEQYITFCKEQEFEPLSKRTLLRILSTSCPASERKSLQGLDTLPMVEKPSTNF